VKIVIFLTATFLLFTLIPITSMAMINSEEIIPTDYEYTVLKICEGIIQLFKHYPAEIWPGFNLCEMPFIVYIPGKWALLFNYPGEIEGFNDYPEDWPELETRVLIHKGHYKNLVGQLVFDYEIGNIKTVAIGLPTEPPAQFSNPEVTLFAFIVHEAFHQFQREKFGEIPWAREEKYPILNSKNTALAFLEMKILIDFLENMKRNELATVKNCIHEFAAARNERWNSEDSFIPLYEQGQEINEGTAKYVEIKSIELFKDIKYESSLKDLTTSLKEDFSHLSFPEYLISEFSSKMNHNSISPEDMPRNRLYAVGCSQGYILDYLGINWKTEAQKAGTEFSFIKLINTGLEIDEEDFSHMFAILKNKYDYINILNSTNKLINEYKNGFKKERAAFDSQPGKRIEITFNYGRLNRSRNSSEKKWLADKGTKALCKKFNVYVLKNNDLLLQLHDTGVYEENDWDKRIKRVIFYAETPVEIKTDGMSFELRGEGEKEFRNITITGKNLEFKYGKTGTILYEKNILSLNLLKE